MAAEYIPATDSVLEIAEGLVETFHPHLTDAQIVYLFRVDAATYRGRPLMIKARKCTALDRHLYRSDFVVIISLDYWNAATEETRCAMLDHALAHFWGESKMAKEVDEVGNLVEYENWKWHKLPADVEEFSKVFARHGPWHLGLVYFLEGGLTDIRSLLESQHDMEPEEFTKALVVATQALCGLGRSQEKTNGLR